jgi:CheY-like chemotaxis protein
MAKNTVQSGDDHKPNGKLPLIALVLAFVSIVVTLIIGYVNYKHTLNDTGIHDGLDIFQYGFFAVCGLLMPLSLIVLYLTLRHSRTRRIQAESERSELETKYRQSQKMEALGCLVDDIAHDFNNQMSVVLGFSETTLSELDDDSPIRPMVEEIHKAGKHVAHLTEQLLNFSHKQVPQPETACQIILPRIDPPVSKPAERIEPTKHTKRIDTQNGTETILVVEDDQSVRRYVVAILQKHGYSVIEASSAKEAIPIGEHYEGRINLLLTDVVMPDINGPDLAVRLRASRPDMSIIYMSGYPDNMIDPREMLRDGFLFLKKPLRSEDILSSVREILDEARWELDPVV